MSDMLEQAIIDAEALREAATKNAETLVLEKFSKQIKGAVESLLEQEDPLAPADPAAADPAAGAPAPGGAQADAGFMPPEAPELTGVAKEIPLAATSDLDEEVTIPLDQLFEEVERLTQSLNFAGGEEIIDEDLMGEGTHPDALEEDYLEEDYLEEDYLEEDYLEEDYLEESFYLDEDLLEEEEGLPSLEELQNKLNLLLQEPETPRRNQRIERIKRMIGRRTRLDPDEEGWDRERRDVDPVEYPMTETWTQAGHGWPHGHPAEEGPLGESLVVDIHPVKSGWAGMPEGELRLAEEELLALEQDSEVREAKAEMRQKVRELSGINETVVRQNRKLVKATNKSAKYITKLRDGILKLEEKLHKASLTNAKLLYQNKALESDSLNERQKEKIVEAVSCAETIEEARVIYETLQNTVGSTSRKTQPNSLSEAVQRSSSVILSSNRKSPKKQNNNPTLERWKFLAGIDKN